MLESGTCLVADSQFDILFLKLKDYYTNRKNNRVETKGQRYEYGDFVVKVGSAIAGGSVFKGVIVEVRTLTLVFFCHLFVRSERLCTFRSSTDRVLTRVNVRC